MKTLMLALLTTFHICAHSDFKVAGSANAISIQDGDATLTLAGPQTKLGDIVQIKLDETRERLYVLTKDEEGAAVRSYRSSEGGNLAPLTSLEEAFPLDASGIEVDSETKQLLVYGQSGWLKAFNLLADNSRRLPENSTEPLLEVQLDQKIVDVALSSEDLFILDGQGVLIFSRNGQDAENETEATEKEAFPYQRVELETVANIGFDEIAFDEKEKALVVKNSEGQILLKKNNDRFELAD